jgi:hypothetical protein
VITGKGLVYTSLYIDATFIMLEGADSGGVHVAPQHGRILANS